MVFESLVSSLLNQFLGDYVENLDSSQLNIGIWGGDVVLTNLNIKPSALDNLDLPIKLKSGYLSKLTLKIPWTNLYTEPVLADIEGLYVLAVPNIGIKYDPVKENKQTQDAKQAELKKIDDARKAKKKKEAEKDKPQDDTFTEKMVTQIIKNLQVTIKNIHVRYEDQYTNRKRPFAVGVTLHSLFFQTTDENWKPTIIKDTVKLIYKLVDLDSLAFYWNSDAKLISELKTTEEIRNAMKDMIATKEHRPKEFTYMLAPISISARLQLNQKPETDGTNFKTPKILLTVSIKEIGLNLGKYQYQDILEFLEAQERLRLNAKHRKYRPDLREYKNHAKEWWKFAMTCIMEDTVKRKARNWSWDHMKNHRQLVKAYKNAWIDKSTNKSPSKDSLHTIEEAEKNLDVFNLNVARQQAELEIDRRGLTRVEDQKGWLSWATSWWSGGSKEKKHEDEDLTTQFEKAMTPEERAKLYEALDYQENQTATAYPKEFVENKILFTLDNLIIVVHDDISREQRVEVVTMSLQMVGADIEQRPSAEAIKIVARMHTFTVEGIREGDRPAPVIASSAGGKHAGDEPQLAAFIETNPLDNSCDQFVKLRVLPQNVVYHAPSINKLAVVFRPPESVRLKQLTAAAMAKYEDIKVRSATGLTYALEKRSRLKLDIVLLPCCVQVPESGIMEKTSSVLILDLGTLCLSTVDTGDVKLNDTFYQKSEDEKIKDLMEKAYDKFKIELKSLQILFASPRDDWQAARNQPETHLHILHPTGFEIIMKKAAIVDLRIPQLHIAGNLPDLNINLSDIRLLMLLKLLLSIPTPPPPPRGEVSTIEDIAVAEPDLRTKAKMHAIMEVNEAELNLEDEEAAPTDDAPTVKRTEQSDQTKEQQVTLELNLVLNKVAINVTKVVADSEQPYMTFGLRAIGVDFKMRSLDMIAVVFLGDMELAHKHFKAFDGSEPLYIVKNSTKYSPDRPLLKVEYVQADKKSPFFASDYGMIEQKIRITGEPLQLGVYQEALIDIQSFALHLQAELAKIKPPPPPQPTTSNLAPSRSSGSNLQRLMSHRSMSNISQRSFSLAQQRRQRMKESTSAIDQQLINLKLESTFKGVEIALGNAKGIFSVVTANGLDATVIMRPKTLQALVVLPSISITDPNENVRYSKLLTVEGKEVFRLEFIQYNRTDEEKNKMKVDEYDMGIKLQFAEMRFVFLNLWLNNLLGFVEPFQEAAAKAAAQAGAAITEGAKIAKEVFEQQHINKMKLDIVINAPIVIVPQNSRSDEAILAHFGKLSVINKFNSIKSNKYTDLMILDEMDVNLTDMKLARVVLGPDGQSPVAECRLLEPITFILTVSRNLSFSVFKEKPEMAIFAKLPHLKITASQEDYGVLMKILNENLTEGTPPSKSAVKPAASGGDSGGGGGTTEADTGAGADSSKEVVAVERHATADGNYPSIDPSSISKMEFSFEIEEISAFLYTGSSNLDKGVAQRIRSKAFAGIEISHISVKGLMRDDNSMNADVVIHSLTMDDCREGRTGITRLMDKKGNSAKSINVLDVSYRKFAAGDQKVDIRLRPFFFCVSPEFLGALAQFFTVPASVKQEDVDEAGRTAKTQSEPTVAKIKKKAEAAPATAPTTKAGVMEVSVVVEDPEVVLVEDSSKPDSTHAVILQFKANFSMKQSPDQTALDGGITDLEIFYSHYAPSLRESNKKHVLNPCEITLTGSMTVENGQHIDITFSDIVMRISPSVIRLLAAIGAGMSVPQEESVREKKAKLVARKHVWDVKNVKDCHFWYLKEVLTAEEATEDVELDELPPEEKQEQQIVVSMDVFMFTLEADAGAGTVPMIYLTSSVSATVQNWSSELEVDGDLTLEMAYFNEQYNVWEPLIEPLEVKNGYRPWQLTLRVESHNEYETMDDEQVLPPPKMSITFISTDVMNITVTKACLELITKLSDAFNAAYKNIPPSKSTALELEASYVIIDHAGLNAEILPSESFEVNEKMCLKRELSPSYANKPLPYSDYIPLVQKVEEPPINSITARQESSKEYKLNIRLPEMNTVREVDVTRAEKRVFGLPKKTHPGDQWQMLVDISTHYGRKLITLRSIIDVKNHLPLPVEVYYKIDTHLESSGVIDAGGEISLPLQSIYTPKGELFFRPVDEQYGVSEPAINWREFNGNLSTAYILHCAAAGTDIKAAFYIQVWAELENALFENTNRKNLNTHSYTIHLRPPVTFHNVLPFPIQILAPKTPQPITIKSGESSSLYSVCPGQSLIEVKILISENTEYLCKVKIEEMTEELTAHTFLSKRPDNSRVQMDLGIRTTMNQGSRDMSLYCPFWMVNKTGLPLYYKDEALKVTGSTSTTTKKAKKSQSCPCISGAASAKNLPEGEVHEEPTEHLPEMTDPVLFTFNGKNFFEKKKACLKVSDSEWSDKFPVDTVGSAGRIICKSPNKERDYEVSLTVQMSNSGLTKILTFTPFYMINNHCNADIEVREEGDISKWVLIPASKCVPFWPVQTGKHMFLYVRYVGTKEESLSFPFHESFESFVPIKNQFVGVDVNCHITEGSVVIEIGDYQDGMAPALIINATDSTSVQYVQDGLNDWKTLAPGTCVMFSWERMAGKRTLVWSCGEKKNFKDGLYKDGTGDFVVENNGTVSKAYWVSFLDGRQRVLLFTEDLAVATVAQAYEAERIDMQVTLSLQGILLSLVNNQLNAEICLIGIMSSGLIWEYKKKRFKAMSLKENRELESAYHQWEMEKKSGKKVKSRRMVDKMDVDFETMKQFKPQERPIRRSYQVGLWVQYKLSTHQQHLHLKLNHFQVDNQLPTCVFPVVFAPVPPPKSVAAESIPKPFAEVSFVARKAEHSTVPQIKYFKVLVQEMSLQADQGFINMMINFVGTDQGVSLYTTDMYRKDREIVYQDLVAYASITSSSEQKAFYDELHFSPLKVHLSFSQGGSLGDNHAKKGQGLQIHSEFFNLFLKSVGVTLTEIQDVVFKLAYFEREAVFYNKSQLTSEVGSHYAKQAFKQLYVLVLGLDIIGNPFGLVRDLSTGVETLFYEPFQGAIQGPEEFAEGLALGVKSLFGHAVGGAAGAVSRITGTLGKGLAALTMDEEYQKKRQEMLNRRPANVREGLMQGGKGLVTGITSGVTGVFTKPVEGFKQEGGVGLVKGVGKGLIGLVTRPTSGLVDFASQSFESVKKVTDVNAEVKKMRAPRYIHPDKIVRPYSGMEAEGNQMLHSIDKGKYTPTDNFIGYAPLTKDKKFYLIVTDKRIMTVSKNDLFGNMEVDWDYVWTDLAGPPVLTEKGLQVKLKEPKKKVLGVFGSSSSGKLVHFPDDEIAKWITEKCEEAYRLEGDN